jgi:colanic acid/amylovoran biosynthesis glycosyltransferase
MRPILLFTHSYPFGNSAEIFLYPEIEIASRKKIDLTIIPLKSRKYRRDLPPNIKLDSSLSQTPLKQKILSFFEMIFSFLFWRIPFQGKYSPKSILQYYYAIKYLYGSFLIKNFILFKKDIYLNNTIFYSYWFNHTSLGAVLAKLQKPFSLNFKIITRGHGFDVFEDKVGMYFPYRELTLRNIDHVYTASNKGTIFLKRKYPEYNDKISVARLGTIPLGQYKINIPADTVSFLSCSSVIPLKQVDLIFKSILNYAAENLNKRIKWTHIGAGSGFNDLKRLVNINSLSNMNVDLKGFTDNKIIREILAKEKFNIFINLSTTEGIPVSIMEAISAATPILATDVGGNNEIVTSETGLLISIDFTQNDFNQAVNKIIALGESLRLSSRLFSLANFNAEINFSAFYDNLIDDEKNSSLLEAELRETNSGEI